MNQAAPSLPQAFKGIALFTPGGDLIYCIDFHKRNRWHLHLCATLQEVLDLPEPPHFLVPCYTATVDRWLDPRSNRVRTIAEAHPLVLRHQALLNAVFEVGDLIWQPVSTTADLCDPEVLATHRDQFPQLWEDHDLIVRFDRKQQPQDPSDGKGVLSWSPAPSAEDPSGYVLRLFVSGNNSATEGILKNLHQLLETSLNHPYTLKVIDIYKHPEQAEANHVSATPTLLKVWPKPVKRVVGKLEDPQKILQFLQVP